MAMGEKRERPWYDRLAEEALNEIGRAILFGVFVVALLGGGYWFYTTYIEGPAPSITYTDCDDEIVGYDQDGRALWQTWCDGRLVASDVAVPDWCYETVFSDTPIPPQCYGEGWYEQHLGGQTCEQRLEGYDSLGWPIWVTYCNGARVPR